MKSTFLSLIFIFLAAIACGQDFYIIQGKVTDAKTKEALPFANVYFQGNKYIGTASNQDGDFILKIPKGEEKDSLKISFLGYRTYSIFIENEKDINLGLIELQQMPLFLKDVTIFSFTAEEIIEKAIAKIPENYHSKPILLTGFYKQIQQTKPVDFTAKNFTEEVYEKEAVLEIYRSPFKTVSTKPADKDYLRLLAWRKNAENKDTTFKQALESLQGSGPNNSVNEDPLKDIKKAFIYKANRRNYNFILEEITTYYDNEVYVITFDQTDETREQLYKGKIFIDKKSLAFVGFDYNFSPKGEKYNVLQKSAWFGWKTKEESKKILYRKYGDKWNIYFVENKQSIDMLMYNSLMFKKFFKDNFPEKKSITINFQTHDALVITSAEIEKVEKFSKNELFRKSTEIKTEINKDKSDIWGKYNYIELEY